MGDGDGDWGLRRKADVVYSRLHTYTSKCRASDTDTDIGSQSTIHQTRFWTGIWSGSRNDLFLVSVSIFLSLTPIFQIPIPYPNVSIVIAKDKRARNSLIIKSYILFLYRLFCHCHTVSSSIMGEGAPQIPNPNI
jgi:hypothetical protein